MSTIILRRMSFGYSSPSHDVFEHLDLLIDGGWRAGLVGRNGRGKTTLLRLIAGELVPQWGEIVHTFQTRYFPFRPDDPDQPVFDVVKNAVAPFTLWERQLDVLLRDSSEAALAAYSAQLARFELLGGYTIDARVTSALVHLGLSTEVIRRSFVTLSPGEQTRALIASLFVVDGSYALIDEPTNHLDLAGRELLADFLAAQRGFLLVSHDRWFLDRCIDHVVALGGDGASVRRTRYSEWRELERQRNEHEAHRSAELKREIRSLERASAARRAGALTRERDKAPHTDKGFIGHRAAKQMKRAIAIERRAERRVEERRTLLRDVEKVRHLKIDPAAARSRPLVVANNLTVERAGRSLFAPVSFVLSQGERLAILGPNGSGKSSLLDAICPRNGAGRAGVSSAGVVRVARGVEIAMAMQRPEWCSGRLGDHLAEAGLDRARFFHVMGSLGVRGEVLEKPLETLSAGEHKKVELARTLVSPADLLIWDEPLNGVDIESREQIEALLCDTLPTLIFVEHDRYFIERIASKTVSLVPR